MARKNSGKGGNPQTPKPDKRLGDGSLVQKLSPDETKAVLHQLLRNHPELQPEADELAQNALTCPSIEKIADEVFDAVSGVDPAALNGRAGAHSWGYVEPSEAAWELLEESLEDLIADMKRQTELGLAAGAEAICVGIIGGLYRARKLNSDGALGWAPDFPIERAGSVLREFLRSSPPEAKWIASQPLLQNLAARAPEWTTMLQRVANQSDKQ